MQGRLDAASPGEVATHLLNGGLTPVAIVDEPAPQIGRSLARDKVRLGKREVGTPELVLFCRQMYTLMRSGVPILRGIKALAESSRNPLLVEILTQVRAEIESGRELSAGLARFPKVFSGLFVNMLRVGESSGRMDEAFMRIGQYLALDLETRERVRTALRYPTLVMVAIGIAIGIINVLVIPAFADVFEKMSVELPLPTRIIIGISDFMVNHGMYLLGGLALALVAARRYVQTERGRYRWHKQKLRIPVIGEIIYRSTLARFARAFSLASRSGVPLVQSLGLVARALDNDYIADRVIQMRNGIERGDSLGRTAASTGMFSPLVLQMITIGEETGSVDDLLEEVADYYEREVDADVKNLSSAVEPVLIGAVGVMVLVLALGVFLPMWDLAAGAGR